MKKAIIVGATGFGGAGLIEILLRHPEITISQLIARRDAGKSVSTVFPHLRGYCDMIVNNSDEMDLKDVDIAFFSTPDRAGMSLIEEFYKKDIPVIDFSGDFRFNNTDSYRIYANNKSMDSTHHSPKILADTVYGLPELYKKEISSAKVVGNPGCFAIGIILALLPVIDAGLIKSDTIICDGKTGVSGAGKNSGETNLYPQRHENTNSYKEGTHQHMVEVEQVINDCGSGDKRILFIPQIIPMNRGILNSVYAEVAKKTTTEQLLELYSSFYSGSPFVQVSNTSPGTADVRGSNNCKIMPRIDERTGMFYAVSVIDNLLKGQAGNAVQNANIMMGFPEVMGLENAPFYP